MAAYFFKFNQSCLQIHRVIMFNSPELSLSVLKSRLQVVSGVFELQPIHSLIFTKNIVQSRFTASCHMIQYYFNNKTDTS